MSAGPRNRGRWPLLVLAVALPAALIFTVLAAESWDAQASLLRITTRLARGANEVSRPLVLTLGGPVYCAQAAPIAQFLHASLVCPDYGPDRERSGASRRMRVEDWGDPRYLNAVARIPGTLRAEGVRFSELILVGASYAGYAAAELAATHPQLRPRALIVVDGFLDLPERFRALTPGQPTRAEMIHVLGGTLAQRPRTYARRSPSHHLAGLADSLRHGMRLVDVWSIGAREAREFNGAMCSARSNALWLRELARMLHRPVVGYVTRLRHAYALWYWWRQLLGLAGLGRSQRELPGTRIIFRAQHPIPAASVCATRPRSVHAALPRR